MTLTGKTTLYGFAAVTLFILIHVPLNAGTQEDNLAQAKRWLLKKGGENRAIQILRSRRPSIRTPEEWLWLGRAYLKKNPRERRGYTALREALNSSADSSPVHQEALAGLGESYYRIGDKPRAMTLWNLLRNVEPPTDWTAWAQRRMGALYLEENEPALGREFLDLPPQKASSPQAKELFPLNVVTRDPPLNTSGATHAKSDDGPWAYSIQIAAYRTPGPAKTFRNRLRRKGYDAYVRVAELSKGTYYRVRVGKFETKSDAQDFLDSFKQKEKTKAIVVKRQNP